MNLLLETSGENRSRLILVIAVVLGFLLAPGFELMLERWMPAPTPAAPSRPSPGGTTWDFRSMWS
jgi:hypothetical protein